MDKKKRHAALLRIVSRNEVETQDDLCALLRAEGFDAAQATVSRDMRELKIGKGVNANGVNCYFAEGAGQKPSYNDLFARSVTSVDYAMNTVVLHCHAGMAQPACKVVDELKLGFVVGTIAGDDTVFVLTRSESHAVQLAEQLRELKAAPHNYG